MASTSIGTTPGGSIADLVQDLQSNLTNSLPLGPQSTANRTSHLDGSRDVLDADRSSNIPASAVSTGDIASTLFQEVATSDITKLNRILEPTADPVGNKVLDALLKQAVHEVANGNGERAVGYLADYATRDPRRAESLPFEPGLEPVRDKIDSMVSRMAQVAKLSAEDGLSRAEQTVSQVAGKISDWDTHADVLIRVAHRLFEAGGYANYSRTAELAKVVNDGGRQAKPNDQALAAVAAAQVSTAGNLDPTQFIPGVNVPYWVSSDLQPNRMSNGNLIKPVGRSVVKSAGDVGENLRDLKDISTAAIRQLWKRAPMLVLLLSWFGIGLTAGVVFALGSRFWPDGLFVTVGNLAFTIWALGFLALVGFGFYARIRYDQRRP